MLRAGTVATNAPGATVNGAGEDSGEQPEGPSLLAAGMVVYVAMGALALFWLWLRDRAQALPEYAVGTQGPVLGSGVGLVVGLLAARLFAYVNPRIPRMRALEATARRSFANASDTAAITFVVLASVSEELFFRLAVQDALGLVGSVAVASGLNSSLAGWRWLPFAILHALVLALLVQQGFGLLGSTTASAIMNHLNLRRIQCTVSS